MLKNGQTYFKNIAVKYYGVRTAIFLKYVLPFFNIMYDRVNWFLLSLHYDSKHLWSIAIFIMRSEASSKHYKS